MKVYVEYNTSEFEKRCGSMKFKPKNKKVYLILTVCFLYIGYILINQQIEMFKCNKQIKENDKKIAEQQQQINDLIKAKQNYKSDEFIERIAREKLGYVKAGEKVYIDKAQ